MADCLKFSCICLSIFLLVIPLVCSEYEENNGKNDMEELLQNLLKEEKEKRQQSDDTNAEGSGGIKQGHTKEDGNVPEVKIQKLSDGVYENDVFVNNEMTQKIIQDCGNKYELIMDKDLNSAGGSCYLHKMNDRIYQKDCLGISTEGEIQINYKIGNIIENTTLLSSIKGIDGCTGRNVSELIEETVERRDFDGHEKRLAERWFCGYCRVYTVYCTVVCAQESGWWWGRRCVRYVVRCEYYCRSICG
ncbi:hypothetical protein ACJMK2_012920 [Sinanodonta woodiana]|uniref:Uncharacterized protein n=1 Tax=Sinanodonta woodiana TaxID=1069815 RepID=A0ABD3VAY1_SINWO